MLKNEDLFEMYKMTGDEIYVYMLKQNNKGIFCEKLKKYSTGVNGEDADYIYDLSITKTIKSYDVNNGKFSTLLGTVLERDLQREFTKKVNEDKRYGNVLYLDTEFKEDESNNGNTYGERTDDDSLITKPIYFENKNETKDLQEDILNAIDTSKTKKIKRDPYYVLFNMLMDGASQTDVAKELGVTRNRVFLMLKAIRDSEKVKKILNEKYDYVV